ncbi:response regulator NasT [Lachnotalea glycerini]|uniref:ANTAR domain-containing protein n=1 Tax=Lachnotalea glycerini TaxID=1763509 RepID=A0A318EM69_9FIRM|nr:ANTAR domain-containing protein [Lachnotalea glycerini]PXV86246.1 response regulator NasT [Lachnotalea glycerini]RDY31579.1 ANTAR domain-containing protein [Lachnotalea glycerini]
MVNLIVVFPNMVDAKNIRNLLVRNGYSVAATCTSGAQALNYADSLNYGIIVCGYKFADMMYSDLHECLSSNFEMLLVASPHILSIGKNTDIICLSMPIKAYDLVNTVDMMVLTMDRRIKKLKSKPRERNEHEKELIQQAKLLLMDRNNMSEEEAHRYIQRCSMDSGTNLVETAQMILTLMRE